MTSRRLLALGAIATLAIGAAACSPDDAEPTPTAAPTTEATESPSASAEETTATESSTPSIPPPDPADYPGKDEHTEEGAKQAVRYFWALIIWGYQTGDTSRLEHLFDESCQNCVDNYESIKFARDNGKLWTSASVTDEDIYLDDSGDYEVVVQYVFVVAAHDEPDYESDKVESKPDTRFLTANGLEWRDDRWVMSGSAIESEVVG